MWPTSSEPEITGTLVLTGEIDFAITTAVRFEKVELFPAELVAVTVARRAEPTSLVATR